MIFLEMVMNFRRETFFPSWCGSLNCCLQNWVIVQWIINLCLSHYNWIQAMIIPFDTHIVLMWVYHFDIFLHWRLTNSFFKFNVNKEKSVQPCEPKSSQDSLLHNHEAIKLNLCSFLFHRIKRQFFLHLSMNLAKNWELPWIRRRISLSW